MQINNKKREKPEDFIGWKSPDGKLEVIGFADKNGKNGRKLFKVTCTECSKDKELFPDGYFVSTKYDLKDGKRPCGCSSNPRWEDWQYLIKATRIGNGRFIVHGFAEKFAGAHTKLNLECIHDHHKWRSGINNTMNGRGCPVCKGTNTTSRQKIPDCVALSRCISICEEMGYEFVGFVGGYKGVLKTRFEYICPIHGKQEVNYNTFVNTGSRCPCCWREKQIELGDRNGYYPERKDEQDYLYILNFDNKFVKVGRSFDVDGRIDNLKTPSLSGIKNVIKLRVFTATHKEIYDFEQNLLKYLRGKGYQWYVSWSTECFDTGCLPLLNSTLDNCNIEELEIK